MRKNVNAKEAILVKNIDMSVNQAVRDRNKQNKVEAIANRRAMRRRAIRRHYYRNIAIITFMIMISTGSAVAWDAYNDVKETIIEAEAVKMSDKITIVEVPEEKIQEEKIEIVERDEELSEDYPYDVPEGYSVYDVKTFEVSAFTASKDETDADPCTPANSKINLCDGSMDDVCVVASDYKFGTKMIVNGKLCESHDVMNARYRGSFSHIDILMETKAEAKQWGRQNVEVVVLKKV